jgi:hypothetical protein
MIASPAPSLVLSWIVGHDPDDIVLNITNQSVPNNSGINRGEDAANIFSDAAGTDPLGYHVRVDISLAYIENGVNHPSGPHWIAEGGFDSFRQCSGRPLHPKHHLARLDGSVFGGQTEP